MYFCGLYRIIMNDRKLTLQECAMRFGTIMGLFWAFKFVLLPIGFIIPIFHIVFLGLTIFVPILGFIFATRYRKTYCDNIISFGQAFSFTLFMFMFASLLVALVHYIYFQYVDNQFILTQWLSLMEQTKSMNNSPEYIQTLTQLEDAVKQIAALSPIELTFQLLTQNVFYGLLMALPIAAIVTRKK